MRNSECGLRNMKSGTRKMCHSEKSNRLFRKVESGGEVQNAKCGAQSLLIFH
jgi:hypothetical protein